MRRPAGTRAVTLEVPQLIVALRQVLLPNLRYTTARSTLSLSSGLPPRRCGIREKSGTKIVSSTREPLLVTDVLWQKESATRGLRYPCNVLELV
eukprot:3575974-Rhodomonas_salina.1